MASSDYLFDVLIRQQTQLEGLKSEYLDRFEEILSTVQNSIISTISAYESLSELDQDTFELVLESILRDIRNILEDYVQELSRDLKEVSDHEVEFILSAILLAIAAKDKIVVPESGLAWERIGTSPVQATGQLLNTYLQGWVDRTVGTVEGTLRNAAIQGWTLAQIVRSIKGTKSANYTDGLIGKIFRDAKAVIATAVQHVSNVSRGVVYGANSTRRGSLLIGYRWISVLDNRTTQICRSLDGRVFEYEKGPLPPIHIMCRSTTAPEFEDSVDLLEGSTRPSMFGPVRANLTYYQWLMLQPAWFQDSILGPTRGRLLREGGLSAEEFARLNLGRTFDPLTLEEMRRRWPQIFEQAGL